MKDLLFTHDHPFIKYKGEYYSTGAYSIEVWERYLSVFAKIRIISRIREVDQIELSSLNNVSHPKVSFVSTLDLNIYSKVLPSTYRNDEILNTIRDASFLIVRLPSFYGVVISKLANSVGKPILYECVGDAYTALFYHGSIWGKLFAPIFERQVRKEISKSTHCIYVTKKFLQKKYPSNGMTESISNVCLLKTNNNLFLKRIEKIKKGFEDGQTIKFGIVGSPLIRYKGVHVALKALKKLSDEGTKCTLQVLGKGEEKEVRNYIKSLGGEKIIDFRGIIPSGQPVIDWMSKLDIYLQPSFQEGLPRALLEAMSTGCPALASSTAGIPEILNSEMLHKPGDWRNLYSSMRLLISSPNLMEIEALRNFNMTKNYSEGLNNLKRKAIFNAFVDGA